jgi:deoxyribonucleoside regulator
VVQINGGVSLNRRPGTAAATAVAMAQKGGGSATLLPSPAILEHLATKQAIESDRVVGGVIDLARSADAYLFSAGPADHTSVHIESGYLTDADVDLLVQKGAVGDVVGRYIDSDGNIVDPALDARTVGLTLDDLRAGSLRIAVIAGRAKHAVADAVVRSGLCSVLVTDEATALHLLDG